MKISFIVPFVFIYLNCVVASEVPIDNLAAYLRVDAFLLNAESGDSDTYDCYVQYKNKDRRHSRLFVINERLNKTVLQFDPLDNSLIKIFPQDVNNDGRIELISEWTHGNALQIAIHTLGPSPKLIFQQYYRYGISISQGSDFKTRIVIYSGLGIGKNLIIQEYIWSEQKSGFVLNKSYEKSPLK